jgi:hypothetical protein
VSRFPPPPQDQGASARDWVVERIRRDRRLVRMLTQAFVEELMAVEVEARCWTPTGERLTRRNGYRHALFPLASGAMPVRVPRLRQGGYNPAWLTADAAPDEDELVAALGAAYVEGLADEDVAPLLATLRADPLSGEQRSMLVGAMNARIDALHGRLLLDVHGDDVTIETRRGGGDDGAVAIASTTVDGEPDVLGLVVGAADIRAADDELRDDLAARGLRGDVPPTEEPAQRRFRRGVSILSRPHGRLEAHDEELDEPAPGWVRRRVTLLLAAVAAVVLIAAVVVGTSAAERSQPDPAPPPATTVAPRTAGSTVSGPAPATPTTLAADVTNATVAPPSHATVPPDCTTAPGGARAPWLDEVQCQAAAASTG